MVIAVVSLFMSLTKSQTNNCTDVLSSVLHRSLEQFGDKFSIKHVPNVVQNGKSAPGPFSAAEELLIVISKCTNHSSCCWAPSAIRQIAGARCSSVKCVPERSL